MIIIGVVVIIAALMALCWLMFNLAAYALPLFVGIVAAQYAHGFGGGWPGAIVIGVLAAMSTLAMGQLAIAFIRPVWVKLLIAALFVFPATAAGYFAAYGLTHGLTHEATSAIIVGVIGAIAVGVTAFIRMGSVATQPPASGMPPIAA